MKNLRTYLVITLLVSILFKMPAFCQEDTVTIPITTIREHKITKEEKIIKEAVIAEEYINIKDLSDEEVFFIVEDMPTFKGGKPEVEFRKYIAQNLHYPDSAAVHGISGRVIIQFAVDQEGDVINPKVVRSVDPYLDAEAIRVISTSPKWEPGMQRGKKVIVLFTFPISFVLQ